MQGMLAERDFLRNGGVKRGAEIEEPPAYEPPTYNAHVETPPYEAPTYEPYQAPVYEPYQAPVLPFDEQPVKMPTYSEVPPPALLTCPARCLAGRVA